MRGGALIYSSPLIDRFSYCIHCWLSVSSQLIRTHWRSALTRPRSITRCGKPRPYPCFFFWNINFTTLQRDWIFRRNFRSPPILRKSRGKNHGYETMIWPQIFIPRAASSRFQSSLVVPKSILLLVAWWRWGHGGEKAGKNGRGEKRETFPVQSTTRTGSRLWNSDGS